MNLRSLHVDPASAEKLSRRIANSVGKCVGRELKAYAYDFISASGSQRWRAFITESGASISDIEQYFQYLPSADSKEGALAALVSSCFVFFGVGSAEELELKLTVLGEHAVKNMLMRL